MFDINECVENYVRKSVDNELLNIIGMINEKIERVEKLNEPDRLEDRMVIEAYKDMKHEVQRIRIKYAERVGF